MLGSDSTAISGELWFPHLVQRDALQDLGRKAHQHPDQSELSTGDHNEEPAWTGPELGPCKVGHTSCMGSEHWSNRMLPTEPLWQTFITDHFSCCSLTNHTPQLSLHRSKDSGNFFFCSLRADLNRHGGKIKDLLKSCSAAH